jgi:hypothetical protein
LLPALFQDGHLPAHLEIHRILPVVLTINTTPAH